MNYLKLYILLFSITFFAQKARVKGVILNEDKQPISDVTVTDGIISTISDANGFYSLEIDALKSVTIVFSSESYKKSSITLQLKKNEDYEFYPLLNNSTEQIGEVVVVGKNKKRVEGLQSVSPVVIRRIPGANSGVESVIKTMIGTSGNNELSTAYNVRGGNFDENLVYVNEIEVYRPFLVRSGQQEGLSFTNTDMVENVDFSAGGFKANFGDKMASVLDITYRRPKRFQAGLDASFLGGSIFADVVSPNQKWSSITGVRYRNNALLVNSQDTQTNFRPSFFDVQSLINYNFNTKWNFSFLGNISQNNYFYQPTFRQTNFGTISDPIALLVVYEGQEKDKYTTVFGAFKAIYEQDNYNKYRYILSAYHTKEQEYYDILAQYRLGEVDSNIGSETFGGVTYSRGIGSQLNHARNNLDALIVSNEVKGTHKISSKTLIDWGIKHNLEDIRDRLVEWEVIDSAGFSIRPPRVEFQNDQPYSPFVGPIQPFQYYKSTNFTKINRFQGFANWNYNSKIKEHDFFINAGIRAHQWSVIDGKIKGKSFLTISPRLQFVFKPNWKRDMLFRFATGIYNQPPFYRELRAFDGTVNENVGAQKSIHVVLAHEYSFSLWKRPFKLVSEVYHKSMTDVNAYTVDNVRIRYLANNDSKAYVYGFDTRLNGEFVPGVESWFTFGYLKTEENQNGRGYIARPTDQRLKFAILFQDYMPVLPNLKMYLNLVYNTGLPGGSPAYADPYKFQFRLNDYRRADLGFSYVFKDAQLGQNKKWLKDVQELTFGFEIFNMFNNQNAITNTWVRDVYSKVQFGVPNFLTTRVFNLRLGIRI